MDQSMQRVFYGARVESVKLLARINEFFRETVPRVFRRKFL